MHSYYISRCNTIIFYLLYDSLGISSDSFYYKSWQNNEKVETFKRKADARLRTVAERIDLTPNKKTRSFQRRDSTVKFIERPCELCEKMGHKEKWYFSFECPV